jgi:hypothetical protein
MVTEKRLTTLALALSLVASVQAAALAQDNYDETLMRAREGLSLSRRDREAAAGLLEQWRASEVVASGTGDASLGRALEAMVAGRSLASDESGALRRYATSCRRDRASAAKRNLSPGNKGGPPAVGGLESSNASNDRWWLVPVAGVTVVILGAAWMLAARAFQARQR